MRDARIALMVVLLLAAPAAFSQTAGAPSAKLYCWKNNAGKTECGDKVPYEYQDAGIKEIRLFNAEGERTFYEEGGFRVRPSGTPFLSIASFGMFAFPPQARENSTACVG